MIGPEMDSMKWVLNIPKEFFLSWRNCPRTKQPLKTMEALTQKLNSSQQSSTNDNFSQQKWRGNFRGRSYQNRENRGYRGNQGYYNSQNNGSNNQNRGRYGNNFNRGNYRGGNEFGGNNRENFSNNYNNSNHDSFQDQGGNTNNETTFTTGNPEGLIETTEFSQTVCYNCGYPNHTARNCEARGKSNSRGGQIPFNSQRQPVQTIKLIIIKIKWMHLLNLNFHKSQLRTWNNWYSFKHFRN